MVTSVTKKNNLVLVSGFAQTPKGIPSNHSHKYLGVILLIDSTTNVIVEVDFSVIFSDLAKRILKSEIEGYCIDDSFAGFSDGVKRNISLPSLGAILQATRAAIDRYSEHIKSKDFK
ncbi:hypothetical protein CSV79_12925 [Sporosarcina sp. P13]|uniref:DUF3870 domain-containing protein n=1 Tax=Sporosarcina sp. P13 TaxID=2048263 RepID=UPI000C16A6DA|nr:DUF3870 domain-containing protein [Sporosarcina sp. P13]PIC63239.1 hypothetical protein CSV79_12925 [Sporosarcina sp. P13]